MNRHALDAEGVEEFLGCKPMGHLSEQSSGGYRRDELLHCADVDL